MGDRGARKENRSDEKSNWLHGVITAATTGTSPGSTAFANRANEPNLGDIRTDGGHDSDQTNPSLPRCGSDETNPTPGRRHSDETNPTSAPRCSSETNPTPTPRGFDETNPSPPPAHFRRNEPNPGRDLADRSRLDAHGSSGHNETVPGQSLGTRRLGSFRLPVGCSMSTIPHSDGSSGARRAPYGTAN